MYFPCIFAVAHRSDGGRNDRVGERKHADNKTFHYSWIGINTHICINLTGKLDTLLHFGRRKGLSNQICPFFFSFPWLQKRYFLTFNAAVGAMLSACVASVVCANSGQRATHFTSQTIAKTNAISIAGHRVWQ